MHAETQTARGMAVARVDHAIDRVDRAVFGGAEHRHGEQHRLALAFVLRQRGIERIEVDPHPALGQQVQLRAAEAEQLQSLAPRIMRGDWRKYLRHAQLRMRGEETGQAELLDPLRLHRRLPAPARRHGLRGQPGLPLLKQRDASLGREVESGPVVRGHGNVGRAGSAQRDRERLQC